MLSVDVVNDRIHAGQRFSFTLQRTLRLPDDGKTYPLPPGLGPFPVLRVSDYKAAVPTSWLERGGFFVPLYQREALWLQFEAAWWKPNAIMIRAGGINVVSGESQNDQLSDSPQNYVVCPGQPWLDGINAGDGVIRQFVATPLGRGDTIEEQLTGDHRYGGFQLSVFEPVPGKFPDEAPPGGDIRFESAFELAGSGMGIAAGGRMEQKIYPDEHGLETWDQETYAHVFINLVNSEQFLAITGREPPPSPISAHLYTNMGLPWFRLYDEQRGDVASPESLTRVRSLRERELDRGEVDDEEEILDIDPSQIISFKNKKSIE